MRGNPLIGNVTEQTLRNVASVLEVLARVEYPDDGPTEDEQWGMFLLHSSCRSALRFEIDRGAGEVTDA